MEMKEINEAKELWEAWLELIQRNRHAGAGYTRRLLLEKMEHAERRCRDQIKTKEIETKLVLELKMRHI